MSSPPRPWNDGAASRRLGRVSGVTQGVPRECLGGVSRKCLGSVSGVSLKCVSEVPRGCLGCVSEASPRLIPRRGRIACRRLHRRLVEGTLHAQPQREAQQAHRGGEEHVREQPQRETHDVGVEDAVQHLVQHGLPRRRLRRHRLEHSGVARSYFSTSFIKIAGLWRPIMTSLSPRAQSCRARGRGRGPAGSAHSARGGRAARGRAARSRPARLARSRASAAPPARPIRTSAARPCQG
mmetsp:Transcript_14139/g.45634  ORF Transcript_14139/g.45634 Transcript_14139/m.45634 type:complete len:238 (+) Transcript_14139:855-1568(+)